MNETPQQDDRYLWDRSAPVDPTVAEIENSLRPVAFDPRARPLKMPARPRKPLRVLIPLSMAAAVLLIAGTAFLNWRLAWPAGQAWRITRTAGGGAAVASADLPVGGRVRTSSSEQAVLQIARLGAMTVAPDSDVSLDATGPRRHRLELARGTVDVRVWAPPGRVVVRTPAGDVIDLGCIFRLRVDADGATTLNVRTGWVQLANTYGEALVPAGASSVMTVDRGPLVPVFDDAAPAFISGFRALEEQMRAPTGSEDAADAVRVGQLARTKDVLTLLMLSVHHTGPRRVALIDAAARLSPPPAAISAAAVASGNDEALWQWRDTLPLPPVKSWWRNWLDMIRR